MHTFLSAALIAVVTMSESRILKDKEITKLCVGEKVKLKLESNISTGYSWECKLSGDGLKELSSNYEDKPQTNADGMPMVGAPGAQVWEFEAMSPGKHNVTCRYRRPWEPEAESDQILNFELIVSANCPGINASS